MVQSWLGAIKVGNMKGITFSVANYFLSNATPWSKGEELRLIGFASM